MAKRVSANTRIKRRYMVWLKDAKGQSNASIDKAAASISLYEDFLGPRDFRAFHAERARSFKRHLARQTNQRTGAPLSDATVAGILRDLKAYFHWLADQPGYKSKITHSNADYLSPDRKADAARRANLWKPHPSPEQVTHVIRTMPTETVIQRRDRALISLLFLSGSRETAAITLRVGNVDLVSKCVHFTGPTVETKFGKRFTSFFYPFETSLVEALADWIAELRGVHFFSAGDPLFPKTKVGLNAHGQFAPLGIARAPWASASSAVKVFKAAFAEAGFPPFSPHRVRDTVAELGTRLCATPEEFKAWSQNIGHDDVMTTFKSYGAVAPGRQKELMDRFRKDKPVRDAGPDDDVIDPLDS